MAKGKTKDDYEGEYTEPELRERLKEEIKASDKGGRKGQWSARKSQLLVQEYEKAGGGYVNPGERTESQQHLEDWQEQEWHTKDGGDRARNGDETSRYLPDAAWQLLTAKEREETEGKKRGAKDQAVGNTDAAKEARAAAELLTMNASDARKAVNAMDTKSALERARKAEERFGKGRKTVLEAVDQRLDRL